MRKGGILWERQKGEGKNQKSENIFEKIWLYTENQCENALCDPAGSDRWHAHLNAGQYFLREKDHSGGSEVPDDGSVRE